MKSGHALKFAIRGVAAFFQQKERADPTGSGSSGCYTWGRFTDQLIGMADGYIFYNNGINAGDDQYGYRKVVYPLFNILYIYKHS
ncbi:MAG TPA: hypothetical protein PLL71_02415 [Agriterribacter sp.]|nr:hypothetical protein [Agriterribacter sp.]HRQ49807.1 hypothetical protein [Agriterribacter sp.]